MSLRGKTLFITGASRGIGLAIGAARGARRRERRDRREDRRAATRSCRARSSPRRRRSRRPAARRCRSSCDIRFEEQVAAAVAKTVETFGGIDILVNNASAISLTGTETTADEALRPDAPDQHARHVRVLAGVHPAPQEGREPAHPEPLAAAQHGDAVVRAARRLHDGEVRHEHVRARHGRRVQAAPASRSTRCGRARRSRPPRSRTCSAATRR